MLNIPSKKIQIALWVLAFAYLLLIRIGNLYLLGLFDYDAVTNYTIITELAKGDFSRFFHHASPLFYLFFLPFYLLEKSHVWLEYIFAAFNVFSLWAFIKAFSQKLNADFYWQLAVFLIAGSGMTYFASSRYFSIDSFSLSFLFVAFYFFYTCIYEEAKTYHWLLAWLGLGAAICSNYKHLIFLALFVTYLFFKKDKHVKATQWFYALSALLIIPVLMILLAWAKGIEVLTYPKYFWVQAFVKDMNPYAEVPPLRLDVDFYFKYLFSFEPAWLLLGFAFIFFLVVHFKKVIEIAKQNPALRYIFIISFPYLLLICFLQKAPRGLLPVYLPFGFFLFFYCTHFIRKMWFIALCTVIFTWQSLLVFQEFYRHEQNGYQKMAELLNEQQIDKIIITSGKGLLPYLSSEVEYKIVFHQDEIAPLKKMGYQYLLVDYFYLVAHPKNFSQIKLENMLFSTSEATLLNSMLFLEHSEYTGLSYGQTLQNYKKILNLNNQLHLIRLTDGTKPQ